MSISLNLGLGDQELVATESVSLVINGEGGDDTISSAGGDDFVKGGTGDDSIKAPCVRDRSPSDLDAALQAGPGRSR